MGQAAISEARLAARHDNKFLGFSDQAQRIDLAARSLAQPQNCPFRPGQVLTETNGLRASQMSCIMR